MSCDRPDEACGQARERERKPGLDPKQRSEHQGALPRIRVALDGEPLELQVFPSWQSARRHTEDHFLNPHESWDQVVPGLSSCQIAGLTPIKAFERYAQAIDHAIRFGATFPLHLHTRRRVGPAGSGSALHPALVFLSLDGVIVCASAGIVRTAFRPVRGPAPYHAFYAGLDRALVCALRGGYFDSKAGVDAHERLDHRCTDTSWDLRGWTVPRWRSERRQLNRRRVPI